MTILITGNKGFVGSATQQLLEQEGRKVIGYDLMERKDIRDLNQLDQFVGMNVPDAILHLAAIARFADADKDPQLAYETNALGTRNVAQVAGKYHIPLVYASTGSVYMPITQKPPITEEFEVTGNSVYGCSKALGEKYVEKYAHPWIILRYAHLYGKEKRMHGLIGGFVERIQRGLVPTLYGGKQSNDFTYIRDIAQANFKALTAPWDKWNQVYNIGTGEEITAHDAAKAICDASGYEGDIELKELRSIDPEHFVYNVDKADRMLNFKAQYDFKTGLQDMFKDA